MVLKTKPYRRVREDIDRAIKQEGLEELSSIHFKIPISLHQRLRVHVAQQGKAVTATSILNQLLEKYLEENT